LGFAAIIKCKHKGITFWALNDYFLTDTKTLHIGKNFIFIKSVTTAMYGKYTCFSMNHLGTAVLGSSLIHRGRKNDKDTFLNL